MSRWFYGGIALTAGLLLALLWPVARCAAPETDLTWMLPMMREHLEGRPLPQMLRFLLSPGPILLGQPLLKLYLLPAALWGWPVAALTGIAMGVHFLNGLLIAAVGRRLGLTGWVSGSAAVVYLSFFAHFHSILWSPAAQHLIAVSTILGMLWLYLKTEERLAAGDSRWRRFLRLTLAVGAVASLGRSAILAPLLILAHLFSVSAGAQERLQRFDRWLPLFVLSMVYPAVMFAFVGDVILNDTIVRLPIHPLAKLAALMGLGMAALGVLRMGLRSWRAAAGGRMLWGGIAVIWVVLLLRDHRQILLPYNGLLPWTALWSSFLDPFQTALRIDSTEPYHYLLAQISPFSLGLSVVAAAFFLRTSARQGRGLWLLAVWYGICLVHLLNHYSSFPIRIPSRYFVYLSPLYAWVFCAVGWRLLEKGTAGVRGSLGVRRWVWGVGLTALCLTNLLAVRLAVFRGRMVNTYPAYEQMREKQVWEDLGGQVAAALSDLDRGDLEGARRAFRQGAERRPFLLRYLLGSCRLSDARWITGERGILEWVREVAWKNRGLELGPAERQKRQAIGEAMEQALSDYAVCLVGLSYLEDQAGRKDSARGWLSQLYFLERHPDRLRVWLKAEERIRGRPGLCAYLEVLGDPAVFGNPLPWQKEDYGFGRFMARLIFGWDVRSGYDRQNVVL